MRIVVTLALLLCVSCLLAYADASVIEPAVAEMLRRAPAARDYPQDDAVWLRKEMRIEIAASGAYTVHEHQLLKILTEHGLAAAQWEIPYDTACETLTIDTARTLVDGKVYSADPQQMLESAVYPGIAWYNTMVVKRFPLPAAAVGAVLEVETTLHRRDARVPQAFSTRLFLRQRYPMQEAQWQISSPPAMPLTIRFTGDASPVLHTEEHDGHRYDWSVRQAPALRINEPETPAGEDLTPSARITSLQSWEPVVRWYAGITAGKDTLTEALRQVALERTHGCTTPEAKLAALHKAVRDLPYVATEMGELCDMPHTALEVAQHNYGDCKDKATLLRALLHAVDIPSDYVLVRTTTRGQLDTLQYGADEFNHVLLQAHTAQGERYLDATIADAPATALPPGVDGAEGLLIQGNGTLVTLPTSTAKENALEVRIAVTVKPDRSATGHATLTLTGINAMLQRGALARVPTARYREALEGYLSARLGPDVSVEAVTVENLRAPELPLRITADFSSTTYLQQADGQLCGSLPSFAFQANPYRTTKTRAYPFLRTVDNSLTLETTILLPTTAHVSRLPSPVTFRSSFGDYADHFIAHGRAISYTSRWTAKRGTFPPEMLETCRRWSATLALEGRNQLQFYIEPGKK